MNNGLKTLGALLLLSQWAAAWDETGAGASRRYPVHYIDTPRQFSINAVTELTKVEVAPGIVFSENTFKWNERCAELLIQKVGPLPPGGSLEYDAVYDRLALYADSAYLDRLLRFLRKTFPEDFAEGR